MLKPLEFLARHGQHFPAWSPDASRDYARHLTREHYENFTVASVSLPRHLRQDYCNVYAFCRWSDDLADETGDASRSIELLGWWREGLRAMFRGQSSHPVFVALSETVEHHSLPASDFEALLDAFVQDQQVLRYRTFEDLLGYCRLSANPVGRIVLRLNGCEDERMFALSDSVCTALQLANHWQDVRRDWDINRVYIPEEAMRSHTYSVEALALDIERGSASARYRQVIGDLVERTKALFDAGLPLAGHFVGRLGIEIELFARGGMTVLEKIRAQGYDTITRRPVVSNAERALLLLRVAARRLLRPHRSSKQPSHADK